MGFKEQYLCNKEILLKDESICLENRRLFKRFLSELEYKLKRINGFNNLDDSCYKTLCSYFHRFRNVNSWFNNKDWKKITKRDLKEVYDKLEDGELYSIKGNKITGKEDYYNKIFRSLPFELAGKLHLVKQVMKYYGKNKSNEVSFFTESTFNDIANATDTILQRLLCWISWDWGENIFSNLQLQKSDFTRRLNTDNNEVEYLLHFPDNKLKRSRNKGITEINNYPETVKLLDVVLNSLNDNDYLFKFGHRQASKFLDKAVNKVNAKCIPNGKKPTWKDFRSSMACHLLKTGWTTDEIKKRMRHSPSSKVLNKYVNYLALDRNQPKAKISLGRINQLSNELEDIKQREKTHLFRLTNQQSEIEELKSKLEIFEDKNIFHMLTGLFNKQKHMEESLQNLIDKKFDIVLSNNAN